MEGTAVMARASERLGFFDLPREIRDEIYRLSFSESYTLPDNCGNLGVDDIMMLLRLPTSHGPSDSHILQISQRMRLEAEEILFSDITFCLPLSVSNRHSFSGELADRFMNLCIHVSDGIFTRPTWEDDHQVLNMFGGSRVGGKRCTIKFFPGLWLPDTRFFDVLKTFTGFETVRIQVPEPIAFGQQETWRMQDYLRWIKGLQCTLGDAMEFKESNTGDAMALEDSNARGLEFHPQARASARNA